MKKIIFLLAITLVLALINCKKDNAVIKEELDIKKKELIILLEKSDSTFFTHTDHKISLIGDSMRLSIKLPKDTSFCYYSFSANSNELNSDGEEFYDVFVKKDEMISIAKDLSDTIIFKWEEMTAQSPYPINNCILLIYDDYFGYMCSIGSSGNAVKIIEELRKSLTGDANKAFDEIIKLLKQTKDINTSIKTINM